MCNTSASSVQTFLHLILICRTDFVFLPTNRTRLEMDSNTVTLVIIWFLAVAAFFVLWAVLAKVIQRISNRKQKDDTNSLDAEPTENIPEQHD